MKHETRNTILRLSALETKIDTHLFDKPEDDQMTPGGIAATAAGVGVAGAGGYGVYKGVQAVQNRLGGLRSTVPGFLQKPQIAQVGRAVGDLAGEAGSSIANGASSTWDLIKAKLAKAAPKAITALSARRGLMQLAAKCEAMEFMESSEFKKRFGLTPDQLARTTKTGQYSDGSHTRTAVKIGVGGLAAAGAGVAGYAGHRHVMANYGGNASGSSKEAYRNAGRTSVQIGKTAAGKAAAHGKTAAGLVAEQGRHLAGEAGYQGQRIIRTVENAAVGAVRHLRK
jgi:hypothetical protein